MKIETKNMYITNTGKILYLIDNKKGYHILQDLLTNKKYSIKDHLIELDFNYGRVRTIAYINMLVDSMINKGDLSRFHEDVEKSIYDLANFYFFEFKPYIEKEIEKWEKKGERKKLEELKETYKEVEKALKFLWNTNVYHTASKTLEKPENIRIRKQVIEDSQRKERRELLKVEVLYDNEGLMDELILKEFTSFQTFVEKELAKLLENKKIPKSLRRKMLTNNVIDVTKYQKFGEEVMRTLYVINYFYTHSSYHDKSNYSIRYTFEFLEEAKQKKKEIRDNLAETSGIFDIVNHPYYTSLVLMYEKYGFLTDGVWMLTGKEAKEEFEKAMDKYMDKLYKEFTKNGTKKEWNNMPLWDMGKEVGIEIKKDEEKNEENFKKIKKLIEISRIKTLGYGDIGNLLENITNTYKVLKKDKKELYVNHIEYFTGNQNELIGVGIKGEGEYDIINVNLDIYKALLEKYPIEKGYKFVYITGQTNEAQIKNFIGIENKNGEIVGGLMPLR